MPLSDGTKVPLSGRPEHISLLEQHKEEVLDFLTGPLSQKFVKEHKYNDLLLNGMHSEMPLETPANFHNPADWKLRLDAKIIYFCMRLYGITTAEHLHININRGMGTKAKVPLKNTQKAKTTEGVGNAQAKRRKSSGKAAAKKGDGNTARDEEGAAGGVRRKSPKTDKDTAPPGHNAHIDDNVRKLGSAPGGSKSGFNRSTLGVVLGCGEKTWKLLHEEYSEHFKATDPKHSMMSMPKGSADTLHIQDIAAMLVPIAPRACAFWKSRNVHLTAPPATLVDAKDLSVDPDGTEGDYYDAFKWGSYSECPLPADVNKNSQADAR